MQGTQGYELDNANPLPSLESIKQIRTRDRPERYAFATFMGCVVFLVVTLLTGVLLGKLVSSSLADKKWVRLCWMLASPTLGFWLLPLLEITLRYPWQLVQATFNDNKNSATWSGTPSSHRIAIESGFKPPSITVLMPVYKESLQWVIEPTLRSILPAIYKYQVAGGRVNIVVGDDGLQVIAEADQRERVNFYSEKGLAWVARPRHGANGYVRRGKFKKASNQNNVCHLGFAVEEALQNRDAVSSTIPSPTHPDQAIADMLQALSRCRDVNWVGGDVRLGDLIFCIDSDHRFPKEFLLPMAMEFFLDPQLGILRYLCDTMVIVASLCEEWCRWVHRQSSLVRRSYAISGCTIATSGGLCAIRRTAMQSIAYIDEDGRDKYWAESFVNEDIDFSLRILSAGHQTRLGHYPSFDGNGHFLEGVSLTIHDEIAWYAKLAYGRSELLFRPVRTWLYRGPFTALFQYYALHSNVPVAQKIRDLSDVAQDFTIASSFPLLLFNYLFIGSQTSDQTWPYHYYWKIFLLSFSVSVSCVCGVLALVYTPANAE